MKRVRTFARPIAKVLCLPPIAFGMALLGAGAAGQSHGGGVPEAGGVPIRPGPGSVRVWIVDDGGSGVDFQQIQPAITAAAERASPPTNGSSCATSSSVRPASPWTS